MGDIISEWFPGFVDTLMDHLQADSVMLQTKTAPKEIYDFFKAIMENDQKGMFSDNRRRSSQYFIGNIIADYLAGFKECNIAPLKLALGLSDSKILIWSEIEDDDEPTEDKLLLLEAKLNSKYYSDGFSVSSTIVEKSDNLPIPSQYQPILNK